MSNLIQATVFAIGGSPIKGDPLSVYFPTHLISARDYSTSQLTDVNSQIDYYPNPNSQSQITPIWVGESVATLATEASTDMFPATVLAINTHGQNTPLNMLFPSVGTSVGPSSGTNVYSYIDFKGNTYYASELPSTLVSSANQGGGGGVTIYTGDGSLGGDRTIDLGGHVLQAEDDFGNYLLQVDPVNTYAAISAYNSDGIRISDLEMGADQALKGLYFALKSTNGTNTIQIIGRPIENTISFLTGNGGSLLFDGVNSKLIGSLGGGFSTDSGTNSWNFGGVTGGAPTPDSSILVFINGVPYAIAALANP